MTRDAWIVSQAMISPLGNTSRQNYENVQLGKSGIQSHSNYSAAFIDLIVEGNETRFDTIAKKVLNELLKDISVPPKTLLILSTTKGNIERLGQSTAEGLSLHRSAKKLADQFGFAQHFVVSNACISGVLALIVAKRFIASRAYQHVVVIGADVLSDFILSGFKSLNALSAHACRPFDKNRSGISLGEAAGAMLISSNPSDFAISPKIKLEGFGLSNDANHISGPSRTGDELSLAVNRALEMTKVTLRDIDFVCAHGTATLFNDEMEAKAFAKSKVDSSPINSLKGYFGHTLGAAGVIETIVSVESMLQGETVSSAGFSELGVSVPLNICIEKQKRKLTNVLKTASGFGGCNAAIVLQRVN